MPNDRNNLTRVEAQERARLVSGVEYDVALDLNTGNQTFDTVTTVRFKGKPGADTFVDYTAPSVDSITLNGAALDPGGFTGNRIQLNGLAAENEIKVTAKSAYMNTGTGLHRFVDPIDNEIYMHTQFEPFDAHRVFPCFDQPDIKATFEFVVNAPENWKIISNTGALPEPAVKGASTWRFPRTKLMSTYITAIVAGPFQAIRDNHRGIDLGLWCRKSLLEYLMPDAEEIFTVTKQGFDFFEKLFGYPYVFGKYDQLFVPEFNAGAMENAGAVTFTEGAIYRSRVTDVRRERRASIILHEMAHMWFGDLVTMAWWDDLWLNESFATYQGTRALAEATRFKDAWTRFAQGEKAFAYAQDQLPTTHPITADIPDTEATHSNFDGITYSKGASVLKQLVAWVGRDAFDDGIRSYFKEHEWGNTQLQDFLSPLEKASGRDLGAWSKEWLQTAGVNTMSASFQIAGNEGAETISSFSLAQEAPPEWPTLRSHRLAIGLYYDEGGRLIQKHSAEIDAVGASTDVDALAGLPAPVLVLVNDLDLTYTKIRLDVTSLRALVDRLGDIEDSLARALCWAAAWNMVRDAEMAAREYVRMVLNNAGKETDVGIVGTLLGQAQLAINVYGDPLNRKPAFAQLAEVAKEALTGSEEGSDLQRIWAETFISSATTDGQLQTVNELLDGVVSYPGLAVDIALRWQMVGVLTAAEKADADLIAAEEKRDPTDEGKRYGLMSRVGIPDPKAKEMAWGLFSKKDVPVANLRAASGGFGRYDQVELLQPFVEKYFNDVGAIWKNREPEVARSFAGAMFPRVIIDEKILRLVNDYIAKEDPPYGLKRILLEAQDGTRRALAGRAKDAASEG